METYRTLSFKKLIDAVKNKKEIELYFTKRIIKSEIKNGIDERGDFGFYNEYILIKN